jgi:8-oxo-dGTP diphosphatase
MGRFSVSAATVTLDGEGRVLLIRRADNGQWQIPGGIVEAGEQPTDAAVRETIEETGVTPGELLLTGVYTNTAQGVVAFVFAARAVSGSPAPSEESVEVGFFDPDAAVRAVPGVFSLRISDALARSGVTFRAHDGKSWS